MGLKRTDEFRQDAVRIALTSGLTRKQVAEDLGVGMSTLNKWITAHRDTDVVSKEDLSLAKRMIDFDGRTGFSRRRGIS
jgi:transposase